MLRHLIGAAAGLWLLGGSPLAAAGTGLPLQPVADVPLGPASTRLDYVAFDPGRHLLLIADLGNSAVIVFDTEARRVVSRISAVSKVHGVLAIPELGRVYASATGTNEVVAIDAKSFAINARIPGGIYPDGMAFVPELHKLYVSDEHGNTETVIDVDTNTRVATIPLGGEVGNSQYDPVSKHVFANVQTLHQLVEIDPLTDQVVGRNDLPGARGNHGLLIQSGRRRAFIACEDNARLLVFDLDAKRVTASFPVGEDPDVLAFDPGLDLVYIAAESGVVSVFESGPGEVSKVGEALLAPHAHVVGVDPGTHDAFFPLMNLDGRAVLRIMRPR